MNVLNDFSNITILCIGDIMLDRFVYGKVDRISPEAPVQVLTPSKIKVMLGGCGNVVANLASLGCKTNYFGIVGNDANGREIARQLKACGCNYKLLKLDDYSTIVKTRFIAGNNHILRLDEEAKLPFVKRLLPKYERILRKAIQASDIVLLSDYNKGVFTKESTQMIINLCKEYDKKVVIDPKGKNYSKYNGATYVKPNLKEFQEATGLEISPLDKDFNEKITKGAKKLFEQNSIENVVVTLSEHGILYVDSQSPDKVVKLPTKAKEVFDVSGAGDTTIAVFTLAIALGLTNIEAMDWANIAAGIVVAKVGTACILPQELKDAIIEYKSKTSFTHLKKIITKDQAIAITNDLKLKNKVIGFTNGCFDLMHLGHLHSFAEAKKYCDVLIVGINSDASIKKIKGESRPLQDQITRSNILAALEYVDYVIIFEDFTALPLIEAIKPDVIAKEGYTLDKWPEAQYVVNYGGQAVTLPRLEEYSTTNFLKNIKEKLNV